MVYGKSGEPTSFMYDLLYTYKTTIAGQLFISMWAERMVKAVPELQFIQINTEYYWCCKISLTDGNILRDYSTKSQQRCVWWQIVMCLVQ